MCGQKVHPQGKFCGQGLSGGGEGCFCALFIIFRVRSPKIIEIVNIPIFQFNKKSSVSQIAVKASYHPSLSNYPVRKY